jgi:hypothetical protein
MKILITLFLLCSITAVGQRNMGGTPLGLIYPDLIDGLQTENMPALDMAKLAVEDSLDHIADVPPRGGYGFPVSYSPDHSGQWHNMPDGSRVWFLKIKANNAIALVLNFDQFNLPVGSRLYFYSPDGIEKMGAYSAQNNMGTKDKPASFSTGLLFSEEGVLEYHEPANARNTAIINLTYVTQIYRFFKGHSAERGFGGSASCQVDINCPDGADWQIQKTGVAMLLENQNGNFRFCSGSLINNSANDGTPFFLTANHCIVDFHVTPTGDINTGSWNLSGISFMWGYESSSCGGSDGPTNMITSGASLIATNDFASGSDFALLLLNETPFSIGFDAQFNGWDISSSLPNTTTCLHHPLGDVKKISTDNQPPSLTTATSSQGTSSLNYWQTNQNVGFCEPGSSGSPLFNDDNTSDKKIIGQLWGVTTGDCTNPGGANQFFGPINESWTGSATNSLSMWLDPSGGHTSIGGGHMTACTDKNLSGSQSSDEDIKGISVTSTQQISSGHSISYTGQNFVLLNPGFIGEPNFIAQIGDCTPTFATRMFTIGSPLSSASSITYITKPQDLTCRLYPNPTNGGFHVEYNTITASTIDIKVIDLMGQIVKDTQYQRDAGSQSDYFDISEVAAGIYHIQANINGELHSFKLNKE